MKQELEGDVCDVKGQTVTQHRKVNSELGALGGKGGWGQHRHKGPLGAPGTGWLPWGKSCGGDEHVALWSWGPPTSTFQEGRGCTRAFLGK